MKKGHWFVGLVIVLLASIVACTAPVTPSAQPEPEAPVEPIVLTCANWVPPTHLVSTLTEEILGEIETELNGKVKFEYYPAQQLAKAKDQYDGLIAGQFDIAMATMAGYSPGRFPISQVIELPFLIPSGNIETSNTIFMEAFANSPAVQKEWNETKSFTLVSTSRYTLGTTKKQVATLEDVKGLKLKAMAGPINEAQKAFGAAPVEVAAAEMYHALQTGMLDGIFYALASWPAFHLEEVCKYMVMPGMYGTATPGFSVNLDTWNKLPKDVQDVMTKHFTNAGIMAGIKYDKADVEVIQQITDAGVTITELSKDEAARWMKACEPIHEAYINSLGEKSAGAREFYDAILKARAKHIGY